MSCATRWSAAGAEVDRVDDLLDTAETISATVDSASRLGYLAFRAPVIRTVALGKGIGRGARRLVGRPAAPALGAAGARGAGVWPRATPRRVEGRAA